MTPQEAHAQGSALQLIDVREAPEWGSARVPGAVHISMEEIPARIAELDRGRPVAVICRSGRRSAHVTQYLNQLGFDAHNVEGGLQQWFQAGLPVLS